MLLTLIALCTVLASVKPPYSQLAVLKSLTKLGNHLHYIHTRVCVNWDPILYTHVRFILLGTEHNFSLICMDSYTHLQGVNFQCDH